MCLSLLVFVERLKVKVIRCGFKKHDTLSLGSAVVKCVWEVFEFYSYLMGFDIRVVLLRLSDVTRKLYDDIIFQLCR